MTYWQDYSHGYGFESEVDDDCTILNFDDYGYYLLETLFKSLGINAEMV